MDEILRQLGELLLAAIPTVVVFLILFFSYKLMVHNRLAAVLAERHKRSEGAMEQAKADIGAAEARTAEYEQRLREARLAIFKKQEARRQQLMQARADAAAAARTAAQDRVKQERAAFAQDIEQGKVALASESEGLAKQIIRALLKPALAAESPVAGGRQS